MRHSLLVSSLIHFKRVFRLRKRLSHAEHATVPEYREKSFDELRLFHFSVGFERNELII